MRISENLKSIVIQIIKFLPIKNKNLVRFRIRNAFVNIILKLYSFNPYSKLSKFFYYSLSDKYANYKDLYNLLGHLKKRDNPKTILEIGIGGHNKQYSGGYSLVALSHYYYNSKIYGLDINEKNFLDSKKIKTIQGSQSDEELLEKIGTKNGPFDIIIDDGSHYVDHQIITFQNLWKHLNDDGYYLIEDLSGSYSTRLRGSPELEKDKNLITFFSDLNHMVNAEQLLRKWLDKSKYYTNINQIFYFKSAILIHKKNYDSPIAGADEDEKNNDYKLKKNSDGNLDIPDDFD